MKRKLNPDILWFVLALALGVGIVFGVALLPLALQARREAARREQVVKNMKQLGEALARYEKQMKRFPLDASINEIVLTFDTYSGYFVSNKFEPHAAESFVVITSQKQFDEVFGAAMVMGDKSHRLPQDLFHSHIIIAEIKRGNSVVEYKVEGVTDQDGVVKLRYSTNSKKSNTASFASPLIVSIPRSAYKAVQFVENGKLKKQAAPTDAASD
jgi:hypothetical protein